MSALLETLAKTGFDAEMSAAEQRGFDRAINAITAKLHSSTDLCIVIGNRAEELSVGVEISIDDDHCVFGPRVPFSRMFLGQYPDCLGSTRELTNGLAKSLAYIDAEVKIWEERDRDRSGEAGETGTGSTAGKGPGREAASPK